MGQVCTARSGLDLGVTETIPDHRKAVAKGRSAAREAVPIVPNPEYSPYRGHRARLERCREGRGVDAEMYRLGACLGHKAATGTWYIEAVPELSARVRERGLRTRSVCANAVGCQVGAAWKHGHTFHVAVR